MKQTKKQKLLVQLRSMGYSSEYIEWVSKRYSAQRIVSLIMSDETIEIIAKAASAAGKQRKN